MLLQFMYVSFELYKSIRPPQSKTEYRRDKKENTTVVFRVKMLCAQYAATKNLNENVFRYFPFTNVWADGEQQQKSDEGKK